MEIDNEQVEFDKLIAKIALSSDIRKATDKSIDEVADLVYTKLCEHLDDTFFDSTIDGYSDEVKEAIIDIRSTYGGTPYNKELLIKEVESNEELRLHLRNINEAKKLLDEVKNDFNFEHENLVFASTVVNLVTRILCIRARKDLIPLIARGVYSSDIQSALAFWQQHKDSEEGKLEQTWQVELAKRKGVLSRILGGKICLLESQASVGAAALNGKGNKITDYMFQHEHTRDVTLVEIKTPHTKLLGKPYRGTYPLSDDLSGSIAQVLVQRNELAKHFFQKVHSSSVKFEAYAPRCFVVIGSLEMEISSNEGMAKAFELQRQAVSSAVNIVTFDELYDQFARFNVAE